MSGYFFLINRREFRCYSDVTTCKGEERSRSSSLVVKVLAFYKKISLF